MFDILRNSFFNAPDDGAPAPSPEASPPATTPTSSSSPTTQPAVSYDPETDLYEGADAPDTNFSEAGEPAVETPTPPVEEGTALDEKPKELDAVQPEVPEKPEQVKETELQTVTPEQAQEFRKQIHDGLASFYALDEEQAAALSTDPAQVLPALAAKVHYAAVEGSVQAILSVLPNFIRNMQAQNYSAQSNEAKFYDRWPALKSHDAKVLEVGRVWRQLNPEASMEVFIDKVGTLVAGMVGSTRAPLAPQPRGAPASTSRQVEVAPDIWGDLAMHELE
jgi:hypothetical protein